MDLKISVKFIQKNLKLISTVGAACLAAFVIYQGNYSRWIGYETIPTPPLDEFNYIWQAMSLRKYGVPVGWVTFTHLYKAPNFPSRGGNLAGFGVSYDGKIVDLKSFKKDPTPVVAIEQINYLKGPENIFFAAPFFDHPPLGGLLYSLDISKSAKTFEQIKTEDFRKPALYIASLVAVLLFVFLYQVTNNPWISLGGVLFYSTIPTYLLATRTASLENTIPPFILAHLILLILATDIYKRNQIKLSLLLIFISGLLGGAGILAKESALGFLIGSIVVMIINRFDRKQFFAILAGIAIPVIGYISWGLWLQKGLFLAVLATNSTRIDFGSLKFVSILGALRFKDFPLDGWWIWGFISMFIVLLNMHTNKRILFLILPLLAHLLLVLSLSGLNYPWYYLAMIPFLAACISVVMWQIYKKPDFVSVLAFFLIPVSSSLYWGYSVFHMPAKINSYRLTFIILMFSLAIRLFLGKNEPLPTASPRFIGRSNSRITGASRQRQEVLSSVYPRSKLRDILARNKISPWLWGFSLIFLLYLLYKWNLRSLQFMIANWGKLPIESLPAL